MYSAVLILALTAGNDAVEHGHRGGGCYGGAYGGCYGGGNVGCYGGGYGGGYVGCYGGGNVGSYGCYGGGYGCSNGRHHGRHNRGGNCNCGPVYSCYGGGNVGGYYGGCSGYYGGCSGFGGGMIMPGQPGKDGQIPPPAKDLPKGKEKAGDVSAPGTIIINLPANARLTVDGVATTSTSARRTLITPNLEFGSTYVYTVQAEIVRDGQTVTRSHQVTVRGGEVSTVNFNFSNEAVASR